MTWEQEARADIERRVGVALERSHLDLSGLTQDLMDELGLELEIKSDPVETGESVVHHTYIGGPRRWRLVGQWMGVTK